METALAVKDNDFEKIIKRIGQENEKILSMLAEKEEFDCSSETNKNRRRKITKEIESVFRFVVIVLGSHPDRSLSLEEFEIIKEELDKRAQKETKRLSYFLLRAFGLQTTWGLYKKFGHFHGTRSPFAKKLFARPLFFFSSDGFNKEFDPDHNWANTSKPFHDFYPLNYTELLKQLFEKRYPRVGKGNPDAL